MEPDLEPSLRDTSLNIESVPKSMVLYHGNGPRTFARWACHKPFVNTLRVGRGTRRRDGHGGYERRSLVTMSRRNGSGMEGKLKPKI